jgi:plasmid stabilization system protein ParE
MSKILWSNAALHDLSMIWIRSQPSEINGAARAFEELVNTMEPHEIGESRRRLSERLCFVDPLRILFNVEFQNRERIVVVRHIWSS